MPRQTEKIITALEWCAIRESCVGCPYKPENDDPNDEARCINHMMRDALRVLELYDHFIAVLMDDGK